MLYPGIGKKKVVCPTGKGLRGKNEMIYDTIYRCTNQMMTRKQISSHIQVLRNYVENTPVAHIRELGAPVRTIADGTVLPYLPPQKKNKRALKRAHDSRYPARQRSTNMYARAMSRCKPPAAQIAKHAQDTHSLGSPFKSSLHPQRPLSLAGPDGPLFEPDCFNMVVQSEDKEEVYPITSFDRSAPRMPDLAIYPRHMTRGDTNTWAPLLSMVQDGSSTFPAAAAGDCPARYLESSLALMDDVPRGASLTISFFVSCRDRPGAAAALLERDWAGFEVRSAFYEDGAFLDGLADKPVAYDPRARLLEVPLGAEFWAKRIMVLASSRRRAAAAAAAAAGHSVGQAENGDAGYAEARAQLSRLSAVQTVYARPRAALGAEPGPFAGQQQRVRLLVMFWRFDLAAPGQPGRTSWRNVTVHPASTLPLSSVGATGNVLAMAGPARASPLVGFAAMPAGAMGIGPFADGIGQPRAPLFALPSSAAVQNSGARSLAAVQQQQQQRMQRAAEFAAATTGCSPPVLFAPSPTTGHAAFAPGTSGTPGLLPAGAARHHMHHHQQQHHASHAALGLGYLRGGPETTVITTCGPAGGGIVAIPPLSGGLFDPATHAHGHVGVLDHGMFETPPTDEGTPWSAHGAYGDYYNGGEAVAAAQGASVDEMGVYGGGVEFDAEHHHGDRKMVVDEDGNVHHHHKGMEAALVGLGTGDMMGGELMEELEG